MRGIAKRTDVSVAWERLYSSVALDLAQGLLGRISFMQGRYPAGKAGREEA